MKGRKIGGVLVVLAVLAALGAWAISQAGPFPHMMIDRLSPFTQAYTGWAPTPLPEAYADSYEDATGAGTNYIYRVEAVTAAGERHEAYLISFGGRLDGEGWVRVDAKGSYVARWSEAAADEVPAAARR